MLNYQVLLKSVQWQPSCTMQTDSQTNGRMDTMKLILAFHNFSNAPKNQVSDKNNPKYDVRNF